jgi:heptosyltransferase-3
MQWLTRHVGMSTTGRSLLFAKDYEIKVLVVRPNHRLGNLLLITPLLQEIETILPNSKIDLFVKGNLGQDVFANFDKVNRLIQLPKKPFGDLLGYIKSWLSIRSCNYTLVINVINSSSSGRLSTRFSKGRLKYYGDENVEEEAHMAKYPVYGLRRFLSESGIPVADHDDVPNLDIKLSVEEVVHGKKLLDELVRNENKTIGLFTYATGDKIYPKEWWEELYSRLLEDFHDYNIIEVLPVENCSQIEFKAPTFFNEKVRIVGSLVANLDLFIAADSGMMHLGGAVQATTIGLFKVTNPKSYEPYSGRSLAIDTGNTSIDECLEIIKGRLLECKETDR